ncbi:MAG: cytochrome-c peroxidase, partial [Myxococcota bacterium]
MKNLYNGAAVIFTVSTCMACQSESPDGVQIGSNEAAITAEESVDEATAARFRRSLDARLTRTLRRQKVKSVPNPPPQDPAMVKLGQSLFFDKELSGPRSIACSTCHNPFLGTADGQTLSRAQGAVGLGASRRHGPLSLFLPRNALTLWNRGVEGWDTMFWDGRLGEDENGNFFSPAGAATPQGFTNALAAFTIIPVTPREEMRGFVDEPDRFGDFNELGTIADDDFVGIWDGVVNRVRAIPTYQEQIRAAFPGRTIEEFGIV